MLRRKKGDAGAMTYAQLSERIEVPTVVSQDQVDFYVNDGYLAVP